jgi:two-component system alkaline phosphatase synthesis response regulator PhoP
MKKSRILIIEDHLETRKILETMLGKEYEILSAENAVIGIDFARNKSPDLILLDVVLPILSGLDACSLMKQDEKTKRIPIILLSVKNTQADITRGLAAGAEDYLPKPFDFRELQARITARLRKNPTADAMPIEVGDLRIDPNTREVLFMGKKAQLTLTEFDILRFLASRVGEIVSRDDILKEVWKDTATKTNDRTIDVHIRALRKKIPLLTKHVISIYGVGYKYEE